jgi:hypothetical protein
MKTLILALLVTFATTSQATVDTGKWLLEFDNGWKVTMDMDNFSNYNTAHSSSLHIHNGNGIGGTNFIDIDTGDAATTLTGSAYAGYDDKTDHTFIHNYDSNSTQPDEVFISDVKTHDASNSYAYNYLDLADGAQLNFNETHSFYDSLVDLIGVSAWATQSYAELDHTTQYSTGSVHVALTNVSQVSAVPVPGAVWLFGTAMIGLVVKRKTLTSV